MARGRGAARGVRRVAQVSPNRTGIPSVDRAQAQVSGKLNELARNPFQQSVALERLLLPGLNKVAHGMRIPVRNFLWSADAAVTIHNRQADNPHPDREFWCEVSGADPVSALLFLLPTLG